MQEWRKSQKDKQLRGQRVKKISDSRKNLLELNDQIGNVMKNESYFDSTNQILSFENSSRPAVPVSFKEKNRKEKCSFVGADCPMENIEHSLVDKYIRSNDVVLELGARFGTTSCAIAHKLNNSGNSVAVEPDPAVWNLLSYNRHTHNCNFWIFRGVISNQSAIVTPGSYDTRAVIKERNPIPGKNGTPFLSYGAIQELTKLQFTTLLIDCEGCIDALFRGHDDNITILGTTLQSVQTIILEGDMSIYAPVCNQACVDYDYWKRIFLAVGFELVHQQSDPEFPFIFHYVFLRRNKRLPYSPSYHIN